MSKEYKNPKAKVISPDSLRAPQAAKSNVPDKIERDLEKRRMQNRKRIDFERALERFVLDLNVDWAEFREQLSQALDDMDCNHDHTECRRILTGMGLDGELIEACLSYLPLQGGGCDCEVVLNVDMTNPQPLVDFSCADCGHDYDEYYMVRNEIWKARDVGSGMLCIGCLEKRIGRQLNQQDFSDLPVNDVEWGAKSLRLQDRLTAQLREALLLGRLRKPWVTEMATGNEQKPQIDGASEADECKRAVFKPFVLSAPDATSESVKGISSLPPSMRPHGRTVEPERTTHQRGSLVKPFGR